MDLTIIIVNWNTAELLLQCLESIYQAEIKLIYEIIVVDNGSTDNSISIISKKFPGVRIISNNRNLGFAKANNQGISEGKGRYFLLLNSDTLVLPGALDKLVHVADTRSDVGVVGPKLLNMDGTLQRSWANFPTFWSEIIGKNFGNPRSVAEFPFAFEVDWLGGACILVRSETVMEVGMLDEDYFMYSEETDWCFRMNKNGWKVWYVSNAEIYHLGGGSANKASLTQLALLYQSKIHFFHKNYGGYQATILRYGLALANTYGLVRRAIFLGGRDRKAVRQQLAIRSKLIWCLLQNRYPANNGGRAVGDYHAI